MVCKVNVFLLMCKLFWQKIGETIGGPLIAVCKQFLIFLRIPRTCNGVS